MLWKLPYFLFISSLFFGCSSYKITNHCQHSPHPANSRVSVIPLKESQTLDIEEQNLPEKPKKETQMHHMHHESLIINEKEYGDDKNI